ncbi:hypothetical protein ff3pr_02214 [Weissella cibaria]|nr:hypothetical protein ff3pr_02214 [Weissella cibaria]
MIEVRLLLSPRNTCACSSLLSPRTPITDSLRLFLNSGLPIGFSTRSPSNMYTCANPIGIISLIRLSPSSTFIRPLTSLSSQSSNLLSKRFTGIVAYDSLTNFTVRAARYLVPLCENPTLTDKSASSPPLKSSITE